jgi:hypothetical protein
MSFKDWMKEVNKKVSSKAGLGVSDLADQPFYEWWEERISPDEAAEITLEDNGFYNF